MQAGLETDIGIGSQLVSFRNTNNRNNYGQYYQKYQDHDDFLFSCSSLQKKENFQSKKFNQK